ncbi:MAG: hypothetical protein ACK4UP_06175 [Spirosomataceae bacterium]
MKIIFICGSLEPGKDGVGDYTRWLASELIINGRDVRLLALNDKHLVGSLHEVQLEQDQQITTLRLGKNLGWKERAATAKVWVDAFNPSWLSLQYVPYAFQDKGLPLFLGRYLKEIGGDRKWHVMFHELCIGLNRESSWKEKSIGFLQKQLIKHLLRQLQVTKISTQCTLYRVLLEKWTSQEIQYLPLFSNIERFEFEGIERKNGRFVLFGGIHKSPRVNDFLWDVREKFGKSAEFVFLGRNGSERNTWIDACERIGIQYQIVGEVSAKEISKTLQTAQYGVATTPSLLIEKSGSFAAYVNHGLTAICVSKSWTVTGFDEANLDVMIWGNKNWHEVQKSNATNREINNISKQLMIYLER